MGTLRDEYVVRLIVRVLCDPFPPTLSLYKLQNGDLSNGVHVFFVLISNDQNKQLPPKMDEIVNNR